MTITNTTLRQMENGEPTFGAWVSSMSPRTAEVYGVSGLDWAVIDMEHTPVDTAMVEEIIRGADRHETTPLVRLPAFDYGIRSTCKRVLDSGAQGIIVPRIETAEQAEEIVEAARYPPAGKRGVVGSSRANYYGTKFDEYVENANDEIMVAVQIETATGADRADEILAVDGIDAVVIGANDLSTTHGAPGDSSHPAVVEDIERIRAAAESHGVHPGIVAATAADIEQRIDEGFRFLAIGTDLYFLSRSIDQLVPNDK